MILRFWLLSGWTPMTKDDVKAMLHDAVKKAPEGECIVARGYNPMLVPDMEAPTMQSLDDISTKHPIFIISQSYHTFFANSLAFQMAGVTEDTPDPPGGAYSKDGHDNLLDRPRRVLLLFHF